MYLYCLHISTQLTAACCFGTEFIMIILLYGMFQFLSILSAERPAVAVSVSGRELQG